MLRRFAKTCLRLFIFAPAIWVLPVPTPALAQVAFPPNFISPDVPHDLAGGSGAGIETLAVFAWNEFIALNWPALDPATTGVRGRPDVNASFVGVKPDSDGSYPLLVWHTYQHKNEVFPATFQTLPSFDSKAPTYTYQGTAPAQGKSFPLQPGQPTSPASFNLFNNLDETSEISLAFMYSHYESATTNIRVAYEAKVNRSIFDYLNKSDYTAKCSGANGCPNLSTALNNTINGLAQYGGICGTPPQHDNRLPAVRRRQYCRRRRRRGDRSQGGVARADQRGDRKRPVLYPQSHLLHWPGSKPAL
jgi:hypothetical protein